MAFDQEEQPILRESRVSAPSDARGGRRAGAGRKAIGLTRKLSLTLPEKLWAEIDRRCDKGNYPASEIIRSILEDYLRDIDDVN
ncbi:ribbon-helix-helix domain-containing protein [Cohnella sp. REN36]|uniref:ribbon-helix-helix domain-containing protein n=1 Tax=Cohnella sp. REN36 TaxID=2887347 RepID=UPI001D1342D9|nr:ribbon-helix-helix domain-containing protein [Cohnella sp. REN36]MCC3372497.1 ribbon-helix-helix domain-containing protein [Cohnella sp. REN36]